MHAKFYAVDMFGSVGQQVLMLGHKWQIQVVTASGRDWEPGSGSASIRQPVTVSYSKHHVPFSKLHEQMFIFVVIYFGLEMNVICSDL
jgi:hypothetical protein